MTNDLLADRRRQNLKILVRKYNGPTALAKSLGLSGPSYISQIVGRTHRRNVTEKVARTLEAKLGLETGWLDQDHARPPDPEGGAPSVAQAVHLVSSTAEAQHVTLSPTKLSELVALVYDQGVATGRLDEALTRRLLSLLRPE